MIHSSGSDEVHSDEWGGELNPKHNMKIGPGPGLGGVPAWTRGGGASLVPGWG